MSDTSPRKMPPATLMLPSRAEPLGEALNADPDDPWSYEIEPTEGDFVRVVALDEEGHRHPL